MKKFFTVLFIFLLLGSSSASAFSITQTKTACSIVGRWPDDFATGWPIAVKRHNANPNGVSAASYMNQLTEIYKSVFKITDKNAINVLNLYENYWTALERDYIRNNGQLPRKPSSNKILEYLHKYCAKYPY